MEGTISEIRLFAGNFEPKHWAFCSGQLLNIASNAALFSLLGTTYGGNGVQTFALPDLRGRMPGGTSYLQDQPGYTLGEMGGSAQVTPSMVNLPMHTHEVTATPTASIPAYSESGNTAAPHGNILAAAASLYTNEQADGSLRAIKPPVTVGISGDRQAIPIMQPYLGLNYVICLVGIFPSRS